MDKYNYEPVSNPTLTPEQLEALRRLDAERDAWAAEHPYATAGEKRAATNRYNKALRSYGIDPKTRKATGGPVEPAKPDTEPAEVRFGSKWAALAVAQAMYKSLSEVVATKEPDNLRGRCDAELKEMFESDDPRVQKDKQPLTIGGVTVGSLSVVKTKGEDKDTVTVCDREAFERWACENGFATVHATVAFDPAMRNPLMVSKRLKEIFVGAEVGLAVDVDDIAVRQYIDETGELPDGTRMDHVHTEPAFKNTTIRVDQQKVFEQLAKANLPSVGGVVAALTEGSE